MPKSLLIAGILGQKPQKDVALKAAALRSNLKANHGDAPALTTEGNGHVMRGKSASGKGER